MLSNVKKLVKDCFELDDLHAIIERIKKEQIENKRARDFFYAIKEKPKLFPIYADYKKLVRCLLKDLYEKSGDEAQLTLLFYQYYNLLEDTERLFNAYYKIIQAVNSNLERTEFDNLISQANCYEATHINLSTAAYISVAATAVVAGTVGLALGFFIGSFVGAGLGIGGVLAVGVPFSLLMFAYVTTGSFAAATNVLALSAIVGLGFFVVSGAAVGAAAGAGGLGHYAATNLRHSFFSEREKACSEIVNSSRLILLECE